MRHCFDDKIQCRLAACDYLVVAGRPKCPEQSRWLCDLQLRPHGEPRTPSDEGQCEQEHRKQQHTATDHGKCDERIGLHRQPKVKGDKADNNRAKRSKRCQACENPVSVA